MIIRKNMRSAAQYMRRTYKNKACAMALLICGIVPAIIDGDGTALLFLGMISVPLFCAKENHIML